MMGLDTDGIHLREYLRVIWKHTGLILACVVVVVAAVATGTYLQRPVYRATTKVLVEREPPRVLNLQEVASVDAGSDELFQTQVEIIRSRPVIQRVIDSLGLLKARPELAEAADPVAAFLKTMSVESIRRTRLISISAEDHEPRLAADIANALASAYVRQTLDLKLTAARDALAWLTTQVSDLKAKVNESELALQRYREQAGIVALEEKQSLSVKKLAEFNSAHVDAKAKRLEMETTLTELRKASRRSDSLESLPAVMNNPLVQRLKGQLVELEVQRSKLLQVYKGKHPEVMKLQSQIDEVSDRIREETGRLAQSMETQYNALRAREAAMLDAANQYRDETQSLQKKEIEHGILKREADSNQQLYDILLRRLKETSLSQGLDTNNIRVVEEAAIPTFPVRPRPVLNLAAAVLVGLTLGLGLAFFGEYMDDTVRTPEQVEQALSVPVFALIPRILPRGRS